jgi:hypothetical protein
MKAKYFQDENVLGCVNLGVYLMVQLQSLSDSKPVQVQRFSLPITGFRAVLQLCDLSDFPGELPQ